MTATTEDLLAGAPPVPDGAPPEEETEAPPRSPAVAWVIERARSLGWATVGTTLLIAFWQLLSIQAPDMPSPSEGFGELVHVLSQAFVDKGPNEKGVGLHLIISLQRVFIGFAAAAVVGVALGLMIGASRRAWMAANPVIQVLRPVSPLAWYPIWLTVLKDAPKAAVFVIFITALWPTVINTAAGAAAIPRDHRNVAKVFRFGRVAYLRHVLIPDTLPAIVTGLRLSMGIGWMVIVAAEMLSSPSGIGSFVWISYNGSNLPAVVAAIVLIGMVGVILDMFFVRLGRRVAIEEVQA